MYSSSCVYNLIHSSRVSFVKLFSGSVSSSLESGGGEGVDSVDVGGEGEGEGGGGEVSLFHSNIASGSLIIT
jgi:hypothetical protein